MKHDDYRRDFSECVRDEASRMGAGGECDI